MLRSVLVMAVLACSSTVSAQEWAEKMFADRNHDFGAVPRDAKTEYEFVLTNLYAGDVHISSVSASCGCTQPRIAKQTLKSREKGAIIAAFNTRTFTGQHSARLTVTIDKPKFAQIELQVRGYIRTDLVLEPGLVNLGSVNEGSTAAKKIRIEHFGNSDWKINDVTTESPFLTASVEESARGGGRVAYDLAVQLKDGAPAGYVKDQVFITTNDQRTPKLPVDVEGMIVAPLTVSPTSLTLGAIEPGQKITKQIVIKGTKPFKILEIRCDDDAFTFGTPSESKAVHLLPVTFQASDASGQISQSIEIVTDMDDHRAVTSSARGQIGAPLAGK